MTLDPGRAGPHRQVGGDDDDACALHEVTSGQPQPHAAPKVTCQPGWERGTTPSPFARRSPPWALQELEEASHA